MKGWEILKLAAECNSVGKMWHCKNFTGSNYADWFIIATEYGSVDWVDKQTNYPINGDFFVRDLQGTEWEEYIPPTDWSKVPVDTKVLVWDDDDTCKNKSYFKQYLDGAKYPFVTFSYGKPEWTAIDIVSWQNCELAEDLKDTE